MKVESLLKVDNLALNEAVSFLSSVDPKVTQMVELIPKDSNSASTMEL